MDAEQTIAEIERLERIFAVPWIGREELFERERGGDPDFQVWDECALACESV